MRRVRGVGVPAGDGGDEADGTRKWAIITRFTGRAD